MAEQDFQVLATSRLIAVRCLAHLTPPAAVNWKALAYFRGKDGRCDRVTCSPLPLTAKLIVWLTQFDAS